MEGAADTFDAAEGAFSSVGADLDGVGYALAISTPGEPNGRFYDIHARKPGYEDWWVRHVTLAEAIAAGRDPKLLDDGELWVDHLVEIKPGGKSGGTIVWEWHLTDHLTKFDFSNFLRKLDLINTEYEGCYDKHK